MWNWCHKFLTTEKANRKIKIKNESYFTVPKLNLKRIMSLLLSVLTIQVYSKSLNERFCLLSVTSTENIVEASCNTILILFKTRKDLLPLGQDVD